MLPPCFFRVSTKALIVRNEKVLLVMEADGKWELPGGGLEVGESFESGLRREVKEELGVNLVTMSKQPVYTWALVAQEVNGSVTPKVILVFKAVVDSFNFTGNSAESSKMKFFSKDEMSRLNLHPNIKELPNVL